MRREWRKGLRFSALRCSYMLCCSRENAGPLQGRLLDTVLATRPSHAATRPAIVAQRGASLKIGPVMENAARLSGGDPAARDDAGEREAVAALVERLDFKHAGGGVGRGDEHGVAVEDGGLEVGDAGEGT